HSHAKKVRYFLLRTLDEALKRFVVPGSALDGDQTTPRRRALAVVAPLILLREPQRMAMCRDVSESNQPSEPRRTARLINPFFQSRVAVACDRKALFQLVENVPIIVRDPQPEDHVHELEQRVADRDALEEEAVNKNVKSEARRAIQ